MTIILRLTINIVAVLSALSFNRRPIIEPANFLYPQFSSSIVCTGLFSLTLLFQLPPLQGWGKNNYQALGVSQIIISAKAQFLRAIFYLIHAPKGVAI